MQRNERLGLKFLSFALPLTVGVVGLSAADVPVGAQTSVDGNWRWEEHTLIVLPADIAMLFFGVPDSEGPIMILRCVSSGGMSLTQSGDDFSGVATQSSSCKTLGGQTAATPPFPPGFGVSGTIDGHAVSFSADVGGGIDCSYRGALRARSGQAFAINATGGCNVPAPFKPNVSKSLSFDMNRQ